jgi:hypothetical protein
MFQAVGIEQPTMSSPISTHQHQDTTLPVSIGVPRQFAAATMRVILVIA